MGSAPNAQTVRIEWPSGIVQTLANVAAKQLLTVTEPPLLQASLTNGKFELRLTGGLGFRYALETSSDLTAWAPLMTVTNTSRTMMVSEPSAPIAASRFYRAATLP